MEQYFVMPIKSLKTLNIYEKQIQYQTTIYEYIELRETYFRKRLNTFGFIPANIACINDTNYLNLIYYVLNYSYNCRV